MHILESYLIFSLTTAIVSIMEFYAPAVAAAKREGIDNEITQHPILGILVYFCINVILAPVVFLSIIIPSLNIKTAKGIAMAIREPANKI